MQQFGRRESPLVFDHPDNLIVACSRLGAR
jgi:hypothetical protein